MDNTLIVTENTLRVWKILAKHQNEPISLKQIANEAGIHQNKVNGAVGSLVLKKLAVKNEEKSIMLTELGFDTKPVLKQPQKMNQSIERVLNYFENESAENTVEQLATVFDCLPELIESYLALLVQKNIIYNDNQKFILKRKGD